MRELHDLSKYDGVSPFEVKNVLISLARGASRKQGGQRYINVGRGNPNFVELDARRAFVALQALALKLTEKEEGDEGAQGIGFIPSKTVMKANFMRLLFRKRGRGASVLSAMLRHIISTLASTQSGSEALEPNRGWTIPEEERIFPSGTSTQEEVIKELTYAALGCYYPTPPIALPLTRRMAQEYLRSVVPGIKDDLNIDIIATEGCCVHVIPFLILPPQRHT